MTQISANWIQTDVIFLFYIGVPPSKRRSLLSEEEILLMKSKGFVSLS